MVSGKECQPLTEEEFLRQGAPKEEKDLRYRTNYNQHTLIMAMASSQTLFLFLS